jgi:AraC-like DNA-binding protein
MIIKDFFPAAPFRPYVHCFRILHFQYSQTQRIPVKAYQPKPEIVLHFVLRDFLSVNRSDDLKTKFSPVTIVGQNTQTRILTTGNEFLDLQIVFHPTGFYRLTGIPANEINDQLIDATSIIHVDADAAFHRLQNAENYFDILRLGEDFVFGLIKKIKKSFDQKDAAIQHLIESGGNLSLDWLAKESCLCARQFERKFIERTGINPKLLARLARFNKAVNMKNKYSEWNWLRIAIECGYYDYQHLAKDYKLFTGGSPITFHQLENRAPESVLGLAKDLWQSRS